MYNNYAEKHTALLWNLFDNIEINCEHDSSELETDPQIVDFRACTFYLPDEFLLYKCIVI